MVRRVVVLGEEENGGRGYCCCRVGENSAGSGLGFGLARILEREVNVGDPLCSQRIRVLVC